MQEAAWDSLLELITAGGAVASKLLSAMSLHIVYSL